MSAEEAPETVREQRRPVALGQLHLVAVRDVGPVRRAAARARAAASRSTRRGAGEERDEEGDTPALAVEERAEDATDGQAHAEADVAQALLNGERLARAARSRSSRR